MTPANPGAVLAGKPDRSQSTGYQSVDLSPGTADRNKKLEVHAPTPNRRRERVSRCENRKIDIRFYVSVELNRQRRPGEAWQRVRCRLIAPSHQRRTKIGCRERPPRLTWNCSKVGECAR